METDEPPPRRLARLLGHPALPWVAAALAIALNLPSVWSGFAIDDHYHRLILLNVPKYRKLGIPDEMFRFIPNDPEYVRGAIELGAMPWWASTHAHLEFFEPLAERTHRLDYRLWPDSPALMHAQSLVWLGAVVVLAGAFYRRVLGVGWRAGLATLLFAVDDAHATTVGWIANRNALLVTAFGLATLICHDRARREGRLGSRLLALMFLGLSLLSKEEGVSTTAYLFAHALFLDPAGARRGLVSLTPYAVLGALWLLVRSRLGYGVGGLDLYIDPLSEPARFALAVAQRAPMLLLALWGGVPSGLTFIFMKATTRVLAWWIALGFTAALAFALAPTIRKDRAARFFATGMLLSLVPVCATNPSDRLLMMPGLGAFGLLVVFLEHVFRRETAPGLGRAGRVALAWFLLVVSALVAPILTPLRSIDPTQTRWLERAIREARLDPRGLTDRTLVLVNPPSSLQAALITTLRDLDGLPTPRRLRVLASGLPSLTIRRLDERTLEVRPALGYLWFPADGAYRSRREPLRVGDRVELSDMRVEIESLTDDGRPASATFRFAAPLDDRRFLWLAFQDGRFQPYTPPEVGREQTLRIP